MRLLPVVALVAALPGAASAQWTSHPSYEGAAFAAVAAGMPVAGNSFALVARDDAEARTLTLSKANLLTSVGISAVCGDGERLVVGYSDGGIDIVDMESRATENIPELKLSEQYPTKTINSITPCGGLYYMGFAGGVLEVDARRREIRSTWRVTAGGVGVADVAASSDHIFAATPDGVYRAPRASRTLEDYRQWELLPQPRGNVLNVVCRADTLLAMVGTRGGGATLWRVVGEQAESLFAVAGYRHMSGDGGRIVITATGQVDVYSPSLELEATVRGVGRAGAADAVLAPNFRQARMTEGGGLVVADAAACLVVTTTGGQGRAYRPAGPLSNISSCMIAAGDDIYVGGPGRNGSFNNQGNPARVSVLRDGVWTADGKTWADSREPCMLAANPRDPADVFLSTWGMGIFKIVDCKLDTQFTAGNSTLKDIFGGRGYVRSDALTFDNDGNLYVLACMVDSGVNVMTPDGRWHAYTYGPFGSAHSNVCMAATPNGNIWVGSSRMNNPHVSVFNIGGTPETPDDDLYMSSRPVETDRQCVGSLSLSDAETGDKVGERLTAVACGRDGVVWVGTEAGLLVTKDNATMLQTGQVRFGRVKVPRNDGTDLADYLLDGVGINGIAVDGADRKWVATSSDGVYLVSADGTRTLLHFDAANSPLPDNNVGAVAVRPSDGEVFFATAAGIVSYRGDATDPADNLDRARVFPNPYSLSRGPGYVSIDRLEADASVYVTDAAGNRVWSGKSLGGTARWDCVRSDGRRAAPGVYLVWMTAGADGHKAAGKMLIIP